MPQELYNEGRVVGLSAWELFLRTALENGVDPQDVPNEQQWLTSMLGMGSSMILKIPAGTTKGVHDFDLPINSNLAAAGVILANPFIGTCTWDVSGWATKVTSYSNLFPNTSAKNPPTSENPAQISYSDTDYKNIVSEFTKLTDGIVFIKSANWIPTQSGSPYKDIDPNFNSSSTVVRIYVNSDIGANDVPILLTGFANKRILQGLSGFAHTSGGYSVGGSTDTDNNDWINGGMLGPEFIPWSSRIVFSVPSATYNLANSISRIIPSDTSYGDRTIGGIEFKTHTTDTATVKTNSLIDFNSINVTDYYTVHSSEFTSTPTLSENVTSVNMGINNSFSTLTAWYPGMTAAKIKAATDNTEIFPPALYASRLTAAGTQTLVPLDVAAPGTVKGFKNSTQASKYTNLMRDNFAMYYDTTTNTFSFMTYGGTTSGTAKLEYVSGNYPKVKITAGSEWANVIALTDSSHNDYALTGTHATTDKGPAGKIIWDDLLKALKANDSIDLFGTKLRNFATELNSSNTIGITNATTQIGTKSLKLTNSSGNYPVTITTTNANGANLATLGSGTSVKSGTNFIEFSNGLRLYISASNPGTSNVPVGSIGIGW